MSDSHIDYSIPNDDVHISIDSQYRWMICGRASAKSHDSANIRGWEYWQRHHVHPRYMSETKAICRQCLETMIAWGEQAVALYIEAEIRVSVQVL